MRIATDAHAAAVRGLRPTSSLVQEWHKQSLDGVPVAEPWVKGHYRGQGPPTSKLYSSQNEVAGILGAAPNQVLRLVRAFFDELHRRLDEIDERVAAGYAVADIYSDVLTLCAWLHGEWIRIHPFADHNGSMARLMTVMVGLRYGIPLPLPGKPRSAVPAVGIALDYNIAAKNQMVGDDHLMALFLDELVRAGNP